MATLPLSLVLATFFLQLFSGAPSSTFTIVNQCNYTVWPALAPSSGAGNTSISPTGFILQPGESTSISVPTSWSGRIWGRTFCTEDPSGNFSCLTGDCGSRTLECSGFGATPVTLAEFALNSVGGSDFYDVSFVDGYNLPMMISPHGGTDGSCISAGCAADLNGICPVELKVVDGSQVVACKGACDAFKTPQYCCTGNYACKPTSYSQFFKIACPTAYSYPMDDAIGTFTCTGADYAITFCTSTSASSRRVGLLQLVRVQVGLLSMAWIYRIFLRWKRLESLTVLITEGVDLGRPQCGNYWISRCRSFLLLQKRMVERLCSLLRLCCLMVPRNGIMLLLGTFLVNPYLFECFRGLQICGVVKVQW